MAMRRRNGRTASVHVPTGTTSFAIRTLVHIGDASNIGALKGVALTVALIYEGCQNTKGYKARFGTLGANIEDVCRQVHASLDEGEELDPNRLKILEDLNNALQRTWRDVEPLTKRGFFKRFLTQDEDAEKLTTAEKNVADALQKYRLDTTLEAQRKIDLLTRDQDHHHMRVLAEVGKWTEHFQVEIERFSGQTATTSFPDPPSPPPHLFGRDSEIETVVATVTEHLPAAVAILGSGGIGKTALAQQVIHHSHVKDLYGNRRLFVECDSANSADALLSSVALKLDITGPGLERQILGYFKSLNAPSLVVLDNFESPWEPPSTKNAVEKVLSQLTGLGTVSVIVTMRGSQRPADTLWTRPFLPPLRPLELSAARNVFFSQVDDQQDDPDLDELLRVIDCVPLAIQLVAAEAQTDSPTNLLKRWRSEHTRLLHRGDDKSGSLDICIQISLDSHRMTNTPEARDLLSVLCLFPDGQKAEELEAMLLSVFPNYFRALSALRQVAFIPVENRGVNEPIRVLAPVREYMLENYPPEPRHFELVGNRYVALADKSALLGTERGLATMKILAAELGNMHAVVLHILRHFLRDGQPSSHGIGPSDAVNAACHLSRFQRYTMLGSINTIETALQLAEHRQDKRLRAMVSLDYGRLLFASSRRKDAFKCLGQARDLSRETGIKSLMADCYYYNAQLAVDTLDSEERLKALSEALDMAVESGNKSCEARCLSSIAEIYEDKGNAQLAIEKLSTSTELFLEQGDCINLGMNYYLLARIDLARSLYDQSLTHFDEALKYFEVAGDSSRMGMAYANAGDIFVLRGELDKANESFEKGLDCWRKRYQPNAPGAMYSVYNMATVDILLYDHDAAREKLERCRQVWEPIKHTYGLIYVEISNGDIAFNDGAMLLAEKTFKDALKAAKETDVRIQELECYWRLATVHCRCGRFDDAITVAIAGFALARSTENMDGQARCMQVIGEVALREGDYVTADGAIHCAENIFRRIMARRSIADCLLLRGEIGMASDDHEKARVLLTEALELYVFTRDSRKERRCEEILRSLQEQNPV